MWFIEEYGHLLTDGIRLLKDIKGAYPGMPVIMNSAYDYRDDPAVWKAEAHLIKSSDPTELTQTIKKLLNPGGQSNPYQPLK